MPCVYNVKNSAGETVSFNSKAEALKYLRDNNVAETSVIGEPTKDTATLAAVLRQMAFGQNNFNPEDLRVFQENMLDEFIRMEEQSQFFYKMGAPIALTKGLGKSFDQLEGVKRNLYDLGIGKSQKQFDDSKLPFDVRYLLTGDDFYKPADQERYYHKITANNIRIMDGVSSLSRTIFMEQSPSFMDSAGKVVANLKSNLSADNVREIKDDMTAFYQIAAYKKWLETIEKKTNTLRNSLIYDSADTSKANETIVDIVKEANSLAPDNTFLKFILPVSTTVKAGKKKAKNINNKDLINTIEGKTRGKIEPDLVATLMDSFTELYQNPKTQYHAKALFDYLIVKDGLMFKNKSFIKMIPTFMFKEMSNATDIATELMSISKKEEFARFIKKIATTEIVDKEGNYKSYFSDEDVKQFNTLFKNSDLTGIKNKLYEKVFGLGYNQLYDRFEQIYATDARYQFNLDFVRPKIKNVTGASVPAKGITFVKNNNVNEMHVGMFTEKFKAAEKGSDERKAIMNDTMEDLANAGFGVVQMSDKKRNLLFKKFIRVRSSTGGGFDQFSGTMTKATTTYETYRLLKVERGDGEKTTEYTGSELTAEGEQIPRGVYAVYVPANVVGTSNSSGVANLGKRPTRDVMIDTLNEKINRDNQNPPAAPSANPRTPAPTSGGISFREDASTGYKERTIKNASADATIAIATDFNSAGEKLTKSTVLAQKKQYIPVDANILSVTQERVDKIVGMLNSVNAKSLNIAGNGIYTMKGKYTQQQIDDFTYSLIKTVNESPNLINKITSIRTGGQTGFDEAGAKAGIRLGIPTTILAPKGWKFRDINGNDVSDEQAFKARFGQQTSTPSQGNLFNESSSEGTIQGGMFGNLSNVPFDPNYIDDFFIGNADINQALDNLDNC